MKKIALLIFLALLFSLPASSLLAAEIQPGADVEVFEEDDFLDDPFAEEDGQELQICDPLEPVNRGIFWFNDKLYVYLFKPVARAWRVVPEPARISVSNFFTNLATPVRFTNSLLQGSHLCSFYSIDDVLQ